MQTNCFNWTKQFHLLLITLSLRRYIAISPSNFCVTSSILHSEANSMWVIGSRIRTREIETMNLYLASNGLLHNLMRTHVKTNKVVVRGLETCKLVLHSIQYSILCEILLAPKIRWNDGHVGYINFRFSQTISMALQLSCF